MLIEIKGTGFINKGAELMLHAIVKMVKERINDVDFVVAPNFREPAFPKRAMLGLYQKLWFESKTYGIHCSYFGELIPKKLRKMYGLIADSEVDVVLDASGFAYSDQMGKKCHIAGNAMKKWKKQGTKVVLLPQAFGPFSIPSHRRSFCTIVENAELIFCRDKTSYNHVINLVGEQDHIKMAPDFTNLLEGKLPIGFDTGKCRFCLIPNIRMVDKTSREESGNYINFLVQCIKYLIKKELRPFILIHEGKDDLKLSQEIVSQVQGDVPLVQEDDPSYIKGIIGNADGIISSRFHGLVSALSQGVPALATGWSHKYEMLLEDYGFPEGLLDALYNEAEIKSKIDMITEKTSAKILKTSLLSASEKQKVLSRKMWEKTFRVIT